ncbi:MAG TPA: acetyl-CoA carboxylase biotin carboxyl carrier protein [Verrucomicrobium sp.]|nr:acetyl-CoA carboxylase biotin carboxyl carrier protein [Verrucomicrobium sp.]
MEDNSNQSKDAPGLDLKEIRQIVDLMSKNDLSVFHLEHGSFKIKLRRGSDIEAVKDLLSKMPVSAGLTTVAAPYVTAPAAAPAPGPAFAAPASSPLASPPAEAAGPTVNSPMVGTFYRSASPTDKPFINVGDAVDENTVVCIIEAMKVMNEIKAEARGTVTRILVDDARPVQYGQPLFELK